MPPVYDRLISEVLLLWPSLYVVISATVRLPRNNNHCWTHFQPLGLWETHMMVDTDKLVVACTAARAV